MEKWIVAIHSVCRDPSREKEFNEWYNKVHLPDILETPGVVRATRYENRNPAEGQGKFVALYELETDDIDKTWAEMWEKSAEKRKQGRGTELLNVVARVFYKQISETLKKKK